MESLFFARVFAYSLVPLLLAAGHLLLDRQAQTLARRLELFIIYLLAISVGASGLGGAFGHLFLSDLVAESIGWPTGSPFQLEMGYANLVIGILGLMAIGRRDGFRTATIIATTILGFGATLVHLQDIIAHGNLAPGNTIQNFSNLLDPILLIVLTRWSARKATSDLDSPAFRQWQVRQQPIAGWAAAGVGSGFGIGFVIGGLVFWTSVFTLVGVGLGMILSKRMGRTQPVVGAEDIAPRQ